MGEVARRGLLARGVEQFLIGQTLLGKPALQRSGGRRKLSGDTLYSGVRTLGMTDHFSPDAHVMVAQLPLGHVTTIYARVGDLFGVLCALVTLAALVWSRRRRAGTP